ncbi:MAG: Asp-tRNA(Asn)/Glu-tRNA(Gln) amidotransferase subunit GatC [Desulfuromonadaceae bacterium]|nr:Asp-tRNA(Asn)/Glu-tRNA(Gln) amidotransferase subunit GatC [Desulfuromonadaceae bacterium]
MRITKAEVEKVARLSRLALADEELEALTGQMDAILGYVEQLNELNTDGIEPMAHAVPLQNAFRADEVRASLPMDSALQNAPHPAEGCFGVPKVIE